MKTTKVISLSTLCATLFMAQAALAAPWVYRGSLQDGGKEANGAYDLRVSLVDANGMSLAAPVTLYAVQVQKGSFQTNVDFGLDVSKLVGAKIKTEVQQGGSGFVQLGEAKAVAAPDGGPGECWAVGGNTTVSNATIGTTDAASAAATLLQVQGQTKLWLRAGGGVETINSFAGGSNSMALGSSSAAAAGSFTAGLGRTAAGGTNSFVYSSVDSTTLPGSNSSAPNEFLVRANGGVGLNFYPFPSASVTIGPRPGELDNTILAFGFADNFSNNIVSDQTTGSMTFNTFKANSRVVANGVQGLRVNNGIELAPPSLSSSGPTLKTDGDNLILRGADIAFSTTDGRIGLNRAATANSVEVGGNASKDTAGSWLANSDARIKTEIQSIPNALDRLSALRPVTFKYNTEYLAAHPSIKDVTYYNVIAQEFQKVFPDAVQGSGEYLVGKANSKANEILQVDTYPAQIVAIAAIQELNAKLEIERKANAALNARLDALEARLK